MRRVWKIRGTVEENQIEAEEGRKFLAYMSSGVLVVLFLSMLVLPAVLVVLLLSRLVLPYKKCYLFLALCEKTGHSALCGKTGHRLLDLGDVMDNLCQIIFELSKEPANAVLLWVLGVDLDRGRLGRVESKCPKIQRKFKA